MATSDVKVTEGSGKNVATYSITEDAETKQLQRVGINALDGTTAVANTASAIPGAAVYTGFNAATALPTAATAGNITGPMSDKFGRQVTLPVTIRDLIGVQSASAVATTTATTIISAVSSVYNDIVALIISNVSSISSNTRVDISDGTNGFSIMSIAGAPPAGIPFMGAPIPATNSNVAWTATCVSSSDIRYTAIYAKNK